MPTFRKMDRTWSGRIRLTGCPERTKYGFKTKTAAKEWERQEKERLKIPEVIRLTFSTGCTLYLDFCKKRFQKNTWRQKAHIIRGFIFSMGCDSLIDEIRPVHIRTYLDTQFDNGTGKTANRHLREINTIFNWLISEDIIMLNPAKSILRYSEEQYIKYVPLVEDINAVILISSPNEQDMILTLYHTGARLSEILNLKWEDINFNTSTIRLWTRKRKGGVEYDELEINGVLYAILSRRYLNHDKKSLYVFFDSKGDSGKKSTWDNVMVKLCKKAGVKKFGFHSIRHHVAALLADSGKVSLIEIQKQLRHKRATTTDIYLKSLVREKSRAADVLENSHGLNNGVQIGVLKK